MTAPALASIAAPAPCSPTRVTRRKGITAPQTTTHAPSHPAKMADAVDAEITALLAMPSRTLKEKWFETFSTPAPHNLSRRLMMYALAYELQVKTYGGLSRAVRQQLHDIATPSSSKGQAVTAPAKLSPGTRLMREWRGVVHVVDVTDAGFRWSGKVYRSLSAIARAITGVRWNGLAFFGLRKRKEDRVNGANNIHPDAFVDHASQPHDQECQDHPNTHPLDVGQLTPAAPITSSPCPSTMMNLTP